MKTQGIVADTEVPADLSLQPSRSDAPVVTTLTLADAMRLGAMSTRATTGCLESRGATCALGAAMWAVNIPRNDWTNALPRWPQLNRQAVCPVCENHEVATIQPDLTRIITHLNDYHKWTREQIASWVEQFER